MKLPAADGRSYLADVATAETLLRLVQSVPSPKAEPIKLWLAKVGYERMREMADPARSLERARATWQNHGRSEKWIQQRMTGQETRNKLTDYWATHDIKRGDEYAILTNLLAELSTRQIAETTVATGMPENQTAAKTGGRIAKRARLELEAQTGRNIVTGENYLPPSRAKHIRGAHGE